MELVALEPYSEFKGTEIEDEGLSWKVVFSSDLSKKTPVAIPLGLAACQVRDGTVQISANVSII